MTSIYIYIYLVPHLYISVAPKDSFFFPVFNFKDPATLLQGLRAIKRLEMSK